MITKSMKSNPLKGNTTPVADKSISHRAVILSSLSYGNSCIYNLLLSEDVKATLNWAKTIGVKYKYSNNKLEIYGGLINLNLKNLAKNSIQNTQESVLENKYKFFLNNSGTSARLLMGVMSGIKSLSLFYGDPSLQKRPMLRVLKPLALMGAEIYSGTEAIKYPFINKYIKKFDTQTDLYKMTNNILVQITKYSNNKAFLPTIIRGGNLRGINFKLEIASSQVKSAILLASLFAEGETLITEPILTRDHTENMLVAAGIDLKVSKNHLGDKIIFMPKNKKKLRPYNWNIPGDFSSAAFIIIAALLVPNSSIYIEGVNLNPLRTGLLKVLEDIGANIKVYYKDKVCAEDYGNIKVEYTKNLKPIIVTKDRVPSMIDEFPILFCLASTIKGENKFLGIEELRYKESDRISSIEKILDAFGIDTKSTSDSFTIYGNYDAIANAPLTEINPNLDHRVAMSFLVLGLIIKNGIIVKSANTIKTSFPGFTNVFHSLGANIMNYK